MRRGVRAERAEETRGEAIRVIFRVGGARVARREVRRVPRGCGWIGIIRRRTLEKFCHRGVQRPSLPLLLEEEEKTEERVRLGPR